MMRKLAALLAPFCGLALSPTLHRVDLRGPASAAAWYGETLGLETSGAEVVFADGFRLKFTGGEREKRGVLGVGVELPDAAALPGEPEEVELTASMVPDEPPDLETIMDVSELEDPAGRAVWAGAARAPPAPAAPAAKVVLGVSDLDAAIEFYTTALGMTLLRKRALVPREAALTAFVGFSDAAEGPESGASGTARLELRYVYNSKAIVADAEVAVVADPAACAIRAGLCKAGGVESQGEGTLVLVDPDGYRITVAADAADLS